MSYARHKELILLPDSDSYKAMRPGKLIFWIFTAIVILQAVAPINGVNSKLNHNYIFSIRLDYFFHLAMFACLSVLLRLAYFPEAGFSLSREGLFFGLMLSIAFLAEAVQLLVPYRAFNINDLLANICGIIMSVPLLWQRRVLLKKKYWPQGLS